MSSSLFFFYCLWISILCVTTDYGVSVAGAGGESVELFLSCAILGLGLSAFSKWAGGLWCEHGMAWHGMATLESGVVVRIDWFKRLVF